MKEKNLSFLFYVGCRGPNMNNFREISKLVKKSFYGYTYILACRLHNIHFSIKHLTSMHLSRSQD